MSVVLQKMLPMCCLLMKLLIVYAFLQCVDNDHVRLVVLLLVRLVKILQRESNHVW